MAQLIGSSSGLESALAMRQRVDALELAAHSVIHWHHIQELYEESRLRVQDEQRVQQLYAAHMPEVWLRRRLSHAQHCFMLVCAVLSVFPVAHTR